MSLNSTRYFTLILASVLGAAILYTQMAAGISIRELLGFGKAKSEEQAVPGTQAREEPVATDKDKQATGTTPPTAITDQTPALLSLDEVQQVLALVDQGQRESLLDNEESFRNFVRNEAANKSVYAAAHTNKVDENERNLLIAQRGAENILREIYIKQIMASKMPPDFPTEEQIKSYYEKNKDKFVLGDRLPVWQIFLPIPQDTPKKEIELLKKQAESIISDLNKNKTDFATAAIKYSGHAESKFNGGFMGMVKVDEMKPEIHKTLMALAPDKISNPVTTEEGIHILKRGPLIAKQELQLEDVREQVKKFLVDQARKELRQAIYKQAAISYPVDIDDKRIEEWRLKLRTHTTSKEAIN